MSINKTIKLKWFDESYSLKITMEVIDRIEEQLNPLVMAGECQAGDIRLGKAARLLSIVLCEAGKEITPEEVHSELFDGLGDLSALRDILLSIFTAIFPEPKKKSLPKKRKPTQKKTRAKRPATRG